MIQIIKKTLHVSHYLLTYKYLIGDANGIHNISVRISKDNPYLERYVKLLDKLKPTQGYWGVSLEENRLKDHVEEGQITEDDYQFLLKTMFETDNDDEDQFLIEFSGGVMSETEFTFLSFEGFKLTYVDDHGAKYKTII